MSFTIFIFYDSTDEGFFTKIKSQMNSSLRKGQWSIITKDTQFGDIENNILNSMGSCNLLILLLSPDFMDDFYWKEAYKAHYAALKQRMIGVYCRACDYIEEDVLKDITIIPEVAITNTEKNDNVFLNVYTSIKMKVIEIIESNKEENVKEQYEKKIMKEIEKAIEGRDINRIKELHIGLNEFYVQIDDYINNIIEYWDN